jgi:hypothetical protein
VIRQMNLTYTYGGINRSFLGRHRLSVIPYYLANSNWPLARTIDILLYMFSLQGLSTDSGPSPWCQGHSYVDQSKESISSLEMDDTRYFITLVLTDTTAVTQSQQTQLQQPQPILSGHHSHYICHFFCHYVTTIFTVNKKTKCCASIVTEEQSPSSAVHRKQLLQLKCSHFTPLKWRNSLLTYSNLQHAEPIIYKTFNTNVPDNTNITVKIYPLFYFQNHTPHLHIT